MGKGVKGRSWTAAEIMAAENANPVRCVSEIKPFKGWKRFKAWITRSLSYEVIYHPVFRGDPRYDDAPYEIQYILSEPLNLNRGDKNVDSH